MVLNARDPRRAAPMRLTIIAVVFAGLTGCGTAQHAKYGTMAYCEEHAGRAACVRVKRGDEALKAAAKSWNRSVREDEVQKQKEAAEPARATTPASSASAPASTTAPEEHRTDGLTKPEAIQKGIKELEAKCGRPVTLAQFDEGRCPLTPAPPETEQQQLQKVRQWNAAHPINAVELAKLNAECGAAGYDRERDECR
jgi:hypothetical protein